MSGSDDVLNELANAVADGTPVDWRRAEATADTAIREQILKLERLALIGRFHASPAAVVAEDLHESILHPADRSDQDGAAIAEPVRWGPLTILEKVGSGTYGDVYRAREDRLDRIVALKLLRRKEPADADGSRVVEEARLMAKVRHPNVTAVFGADRIDGRVGLWMEFVEGRTLEDELRRGGPLTAQDVLRVGIDLAGALGAVHRAGLLHRDIKAQNVVRAADGRLLLTDFGTGQPVATTADDVVFGVAGSPLYLAPEVLSGGPATVRSDIYSAGVLLFYLATGTFPFVGRSIQELRDAHHHGSQVDIRRARPELPGRLAAIIKTAIDATPSRRYAAADALARACQSAAALPRRMQFFAGAVAATLVLSAAMWQWRPVPQPSDSASLAVLHQATSASRRAQQLYSEAALKLTGERWDYEGAHALLESALAEDPDFASARILKAWALANQIWLGHVRWQSTSADPRGALVLADAEEAHRRMHTTTEIERSFIAGSYHELRGKFAAPGTVATTEFQRARTAYEAVLRLVPNHYWTLNNLSSVYAELGLDHEGRELSGRLSDSRPNRSGPALSACRFFLERGELDRARLYAERARLANQQVAVTGRPPPSRLAGDHLWLRLFDATAAWVAGDGHRAAQLTDAMAATSVKITDQAERQLPIEYVLRMYVTLGRLDAAGSLLAFLDQPDRARLHALVLWQQARRDALATLLRQNYPTPDRRRIPGIQILLMPAGLIDEARSSLLDDESSTTLVVRGQIAQHAGNHAAAAAYFERAMGAVSPIDLHYEDGLIAVAALASTYETLGDVPRAIRTLEPFKSRQGASMLMLPNGHLWMHTQASLAALYRGVGRSADADGIEQQLSRLLAIADADHPLRR